MYTEEVASKQIRKGEKSIFTKDKVARDVRLCIFINNVPWKTFITSPGKYKELSLGHIYSEGIISDMDEVKNINVNQERVNITIDKEIDFLESELLRTRLVTTACGYGEEINEKVLRELRINKRRNYPDEKIFESIKKLNEMGLTYLQTGGTHSALLLNTSGNDFNYAEDVGRHNAVDKVIGCGLLKGVQFDDCILSTSGRLSGEIVLKAAKAHIPVVCSISAPLLSGIAVAKKTGITLYGFVRGKKLNQYTFL